LYVSRDRPTLHKLLHTGLSMLMLCFTNLLNSIAAVLFDMHPNLNMILFDFVQLLSMSFFRSFNFLL
jgi:hypothetical protein